MSSEEQKILRRKYKINEGDLDQIPGKNRKRKKKRPAPGVREGPSGRSAGSGPKVKTLGLDSYDSSICAICLAPMEGALDHCWDKLAVPSATPMDLGSTIESILRNSSVPGPGPLPRDAPQTLTAAESYPECATSVPFNGDAVNGVAVSNGMTVVDLCDDDPSPGPPSETLSSTQLTPYNPSSSTTEEESDTAKTASVVTFADSKPPFGAGRPPPVESTAPKFFHRLTCSDCGIHVHLGCVCESEGAAGLALNVLKG